MGTSLNLTAAVAPANATRQTIDWTISADTGTGTTIGGNTLTIGPTPGTVKVTAAISGGAGGGAADFTAEFDITASPLGTLSGTVTITGTAKWNQALTANTAGIAPSALAYTYQWNRDGAAIGTDSQTYTLTADDEAKAITVEVSCSGYAGVIASLPVTPDSIGGAGEAGGIIFYYNTGHTYGTWDYLEAAPADIESLGVRATLKWASTAHYFSGKTSAQRDDIGAGADNTEAILRTDIYADADAPAAKACDDYSYGGKTDWFLPSKDELDAMWASGITGAQGAPLNGFDTAAGAYYWSSSEVATPSVWRQTFSNGDKDYVVKSGTYFVRAVRAF